NVLAVPTSALTDSGNGPAVRVLVAGSPRVVPVVTGLSTATLTQITSGLSTGQRIITGVGGSASLLSGLTGLTGTGG
ncbi:MAG TPA: hypothetical protein VNE21_08725, partial [Mycobacteriales bacterium]|nr:hypothetical protein [Mycobacteriales bacterium]